MKKVGSFSFVAVVLLGVSAWSGSATVQRGTEIMVRTGEPIDLSPREKGKTYRAVIEQDVKDHRGQVLFPKGAEAQLTIRNGSGGGTMHVSIPASTVLLFHLNERMEL